MRKLTKLGLMIFAMLVSLIVLPNVHADEMIFGNTNHSGPGQWVLEKYNLGASVFTCSEDATITSLHGFFYKIPERETEPYVSMAIYVEEEGDSWILLENTGWTLVSNEAGEWINWTIPSTAVTSGTRYALAARENNAPSVPNEDVTIGEYDGPENRTWAEENHPKWLDWPDTLENDPWQNTVLALWAGSSSDPDYLIPIPGGESLSLWDLMFGPYTGLIGPLFWAILVGLATGLTWIKTQSTGPALAIMLAFSIGFAVLLEGYGQLLFGILATLAFVGIMFRAVTK